MLKRSMAMLYSGVIGWPAVVTGQAAATHSSRVWQVVFARNDSSVATVAQGELRLWALPSGKLACRLDGPYYRGRVTTDGNAGFHVTLFSLGANGQTPIRAFRIDPATCRETAAPLSDGGAGSGATSRSRESRATIEPRGRGAVIVTPGGARLDSEGSATALDVADVVYACTSTREKLTYHRVTAENRVERIADTATDRYGMSGCGPLLMSPDSTVLLNVGDGAAIDIRRKRVLVTYARSQMTSVGIDAARERLAVGHSGGVALVDVRSRKAVRQVGDGASTGYVSPSGEWMALVGSMTSRPVVRIEGQTHPTIELDDARSRAAADILIAREEAERNARTEAARQAQAREAASADSARAAASARVEALKRFVERRYGKVAMYATLRQIQYQGTYDWVRVDVKQGDMLLLASERDGVVGYTISDGTRFVSGTPASTDPREGFMLSQSTIGADISGDLKVEGRGSRVYVFLVRKADVK